MENNWKQKNLDNLEKDTWTSSPNDTNLVKRCTELRKLPLNQFTTEDLRIMIGQRIGLKYLIPLALETLFNDLFVEGNFFEGDLLQNVLKIDTKFWNENKKYWQELNNLIKDRRNEIAARRIDIAK